PPPRRWRELRAASRGHAHGAERCRWPGRDDPDRWDDAITEYGAQHGVDRRSRERNVECLLDRQLLGETRAMPQRFEFHFTVSNDSEGEPVSAEEAEARLLQRLEDRAGACSETLWDLARLYSITGRQHIALQYTQRLLSATDDREKLAAAYVAQ